MVKKIAFIFLLFVIAASSAFSAPGDNLTLKIAVMGPGDQLYFWWGHIALIVEDSSDNTSYFFDYGLFSFDNDNFFYNFAFGRLLYSCGVSRSERNLDLYKRKNRDITVYTLDLPPETKIKVRDFAVRNVLPENRDYYYHHFRDNCSTRIRDIIDLATDGQFKKEFENVNGGFTLRNHVRRHTWFSPVVDWFLNFLMGQSIDTQISIWEDMFLPAEVGKRIENFWYTDANGNRRKLVSSVEIVNKSVGRPIVLEKPRKQWIRELVFSLALSAIFCFFFFLQAKNKKAGRVLAGISMSLSGLFFGTVGLLLYFMSLFTNHDYTYHNMNMIFCTPLLLAAVPFGISYAATKNQKKLKVYGELLRLIWFLSVLGVFISMLIKILPGFYQDNLTDQMLILPIALTFTLQPNGLKEMLNKYFPVKKHSTPSGDKNGS
ncbi:lipoprotein N-acyltransferase Lnb domain-containing protein [Treponema sp. R80B11-R83G3]